MKLINSSKIVVNKSKFLGYFFELNSPEEIKNAIEEIIQKHKKFSHLCYALRIGKKKVFKNDGEVGQPGKILLSSLEKNDLQNHCLIVLRIFGGTKLGPSNVGKAFRKAGELCIVKPSLQ